MSEGTSFESQGSTKERILSAAMRLIAERGVGGLRIRELAREAGLREGSIYNHFPGREAIVQALFAKLESGLSPLGTILDLDTAAEATLVALATELRTRGLAGFFRATGGAYVEGLVRAPGSLQLLRAVLAARFSDPAARRAYEEVFYPDSMKVFTSMFAIASKAGLLVAGARPEILAELAVAAIAHALSRYHGDADSARSGPLLVELLETLGGLAGSVRPS